MLMKTGEEKLELTSHLENDEQQKALLEQSLDVDNSHNTLTQLPGYSLEQRHHSLISIIISRYNPYHSQSHHQVRYSLCHQCKRSPCKIFIVTIQNSIERDNIMCQTVKGLSPTIT